MVGIKLRDIDRDILMMFMLSYEYPVSFTNLLKLFKISKQYFWTFMEICGPMLKMGVRKASMMRKSVDRILPYLTNDGNTEEPAEPLTVREENIMELFMWFVEDSFSDGDGCLTIQQLSVVPFKGGYDSKGVCIARNYETLCSNLDRVEYILIGSDKYYKTSRMLYYMEKYCGDLDIYQINNLSLKDMLRKISEGEVELEQKAKQL